MARVFWELMSAVFSSLVELAWEGVAPGLSWVVTDVATCLPQEHAREASFDLQARSSDKRAAQELQKQSMQLKKLLRLREMAARL